MKGNKEIVLRFVDFYGLHAFDTITALVISPLCFIFIMGVYCMKYVQLER